MLFVILAAVMGGEARAVVVTGRAVVSERVGKAETVAKGVEALRVDSERAVLGAVLEVQNAAGLVDGGPLVNWFQGGAAVARSDCGDRSAKYTCTAAAGSAWTVPPAATVQHVRGPDLGGGTKGLLYSLRNGLPKFNRYNGRGDVVAQSDIDGTTTWAASYQADGRRTAETGTNVERHRANTKEEDPTGLLNEGFRYRDMETGTFISRDPLGLVDGPNVYCYVRQNPWTHWDPEGLFVGALVKRINEHVIRPAAESFVSAVIDALPQSAVEQLSNSRGFESAMEAGRKVSGGIMHGSQEALGMLSPMDGAADKLLKGDLRGAGNEAMLEAFGGRVFKAAGKGIAAVKRHAGQLDEAVGALSHVDDAATATATGVRESIEEASSVLAKEGGGVASFNVDGHGSGKWHPTSPEEKEAVLEIQKASMGLIIPIESLQQLKNGNILAASKDFILGRVKFLKLAKKLGARLTAGSSRKCCVAVEAQIVKVPVTKGSVSPLTGCGTAPKSAPGPNTKVVELPETTAPKPVKPEAAVDEWNNFLGPGPHTNIHPKTGAPDPNRIVSADGSRSIRYGKHEMGGKPTRHHYHEETWSYDQVSDTMTIGNTMKRVPLK